MPDYRFGISTHLFHERRLGREHLVDIAGHGFEAVEVFATRSHFDYHDAGAVDSLAEWLSDAGLQLHSMHAPIVDGIRDGAWVGSYSLASSDEARRRSALAEARATLEVARRIPYTYLVVHLGVPDEQGPTSGDNRPDAARRSLEEIASLAEAVNVRVAVEVIPNALSTPSALCAMLEEEFEAPDVGVCLDYGHAHLMGDLGEAIELVGGHVWTTHVHNDGRRDAHGVPFTGRIDWAAAMVETQKVGYEGVLMFEVADSGDPLDVLARTAKARERLTRLLVTF